MAKGSEKRQFERYVLKQDNYTVGRFSTFNWFKRRKVLQAQIYDLSKGGVSLIVPSYQAPRMGEVIGVEFTVPGGEQIACFGKVVSQSEANWLGEKWKRHMSGATPIKVGVKFDNLPEKYDQLLDNQLKTIIRKEKINEQLSSMGFAVKASVTSIPYPLIILGVSAAAILLMAMFVGKMQELSQSKWWVKESKSFYKSMQEERAKELEKKYE